ncbi:right-handed parallel beta-helix repeat-containing protein, partial [Hymenobacter terrenus]|uniref:right-handed parallel beta-helix repeat-containing protein n=1 Tax=Hymenobacter terrenus TaxID=1629124 RepID=UPI0006964A53
MKKLFLSLLLGIGALSSANATDYYVAKNGKDTNDGKVGTPLLTIQEAANRTLPGDVVYVRAGTYTNSGSGPVVKITRSGTASQWIIYRNYPGENPLVEFTSWQGFQVQDGAAYIEINGFRIKGNNSKLTLAEARNQIGSCSKPGSPTGTYSGTGIAAEGRAGQSTAQPHHLRFLNNEVFDCPLAGIVGLETDYVTVENNLIYNNCTYSVFGSSGISFLSNKNYNSASRSDGGYHIWIRNNRVFDNKLLVKWYNRDTNICQGITDGNGIIIDRSTDDNFAGKVMIANNLCVNNGGAGIQTFLSNNIDIINNTCCYNSTSPELSNGEIFINKSKNILVQNNISVSSPNERVFSDAIVADNVKFVNNLFFGPTITQSGTRISSTGRIIEDGTYFPNNSSKDSFTATVELGSNKVANPLFNNPSTARTADFTLKTSPASPAINAGVNDKLSPTDLAGNPRVSGGTVDMGAYETPAPTTAPCGVATSLSTSGVSSTGATLAWAAVSGASSYNVRYRISGTTTWTNTTSTTASKALTGLTASSTYE